MQIQQMRYILEIARKGSISAAAKSLFLSQPSLSQQLMNLERELGIPLFVRHSKSVSLTDAGEQFIKYAQRIVNETDQLSDLMKKYSLLQGGTLHVGMLWIAGYLDLPRILTDYHSIHPGISYSLKVDGSTPLLKMLEARSLNAAFIIGSETELKKKDDLFYHKILDDYYVAIVSSKNPLSKKSILAVEDLADQPLIMPSKASAFRAELELVLSRHSVTPNTLCETSQSDIVTQLAGQNLAIGFSSYSIAKALKTDAYSIVPLEEVLLRPIYYVTLKELLDYPAIQSFTAFVKQYAF